MADSDGVPLWLQLVRFFGIPDAALEQRLTELHEGLPRQRELFFGDVRLFPADD